VPVAGADAGSATDLADPAARSNPYAIYERLRREDPVHWSDRFGAWVLTRYEDVAACLRDPRLSPGGGFAVMFDRLPRAEQERVAELRRHLSMWMGPQDPPGHTRIRAVMQRAFTPRLVEATRPFLERVTDELLGAVQASGRPESDLLRDVADPLPAMMIAAILGAPTRDWQRFKRWSDRLTEFIESGRFTVDALVEAQQTILEAAAYLGALADESAGGAGPPGDDGQPPNLMSALLAVAAEGGQVSKDEVVANCVPLIFAGHETTALLIGNSMLALLQNPDQARKLVARPPLIRSAIQECLRYDSPVQMVRRSAQESVEIRGRQIEKGQLLWLVLGAANRDPDPFRDPDRLDIERANVRHLSFGLGVHYCVGAGMTCLEAQVAVGRMLARWPDLRLSGSSLKWRNAPTARALVSLPVAI
jgi:cytochrome P450